MRKLYLSLSALCLVACMEAQPERALPESPISDFNIEVLADKLNHAWSVAELPGRGYLVTERDGRLFLFENGDKTDVTGLPDDIYVEGQAGLFDIVLAPDFETSSELYLSYAYGTADDNGTALFKARWNDGALEEPLIIFRTSPTKDTNAHFGGRIAFLQDGSLVLTTGEGFAYREASQDTDSHFGKTIRLLSDGGTPSDNPKLGGKPQVYSFGHRNPQGLAYDAQTNQLWAHEHGPRGGDELNLIQPGLNYGWPAVSKGVDYNGARITPHESYKGMQDPVHYWVPSIAASGLAIYRGDMFPEWEGDALIGGLVSGDIRRIDLEDGKSVAEYSLLSDLEARVRDVRVASDGAILALTDASSGKLIRIIPKN